jgi:hypothetical protein
VLHGGLLVLALALAGVRVARAPRPVELTSIEVVAPSRLPLASPLASSPAPGHAAPVARPVVPVVPVVPIVNAGTHGRRGGDTVRRSQSRGPAAPDSLADLKLSYEDPTNFTSNNRAETAIGRGRDARQSGIGAGAGSPLDDNLATMQIPGPSPVSLARPPRPRFDYRDLRLRTSVRRFAGQTIKVVLVIDAEGRVRDVRLLQGVDDRLDQRTIELARSFVFEPAWDDAGAPVPGSSRWDFLIVAEEEQPFETALQRGYN